MPVPLLQLNPETLHARSGSAVAFINGNTHPCVFQSLRYSLTTTCIYTRLCMSFPPRVAYFPDSFHEINGVAHTSREFEAFIRRRNLPFLCIRAGNREPRLLTEGKLTTLELSRGPLSFGLEKDLSFDLGFFRHLPVIGRALRNFRPDLIHITGPSDFGMIGALMSNHYHLPM